ncbi:hypothetical protein B484DRAFT_448846 [Ochromonadaceae sp. CCMP2298]|nr:hypothetical protein B484DRAFT_448846 [Ochromonadaceae sp. CCMP2298]
MDADYLKTNVLDALTEALSSMAVKIPDDDIEYVGKYLLRYCERKKTEKEGTSELEGVEADLSQFLAVEETKSREAEGKFLAASQANNKYKRFIDALGEYKSKQEAMDGLSAFIEVSLGIPAAYVALKKTAGESETLNYVSASPSQAHMLGKKLLKPSAEEGDDAPARQGISFEAFKLPEVPEEEAAEEEEGVAVPLKAPPKAQPLLVDNAMRELRCKFFGIPRLGSFAAVPFSYPSIDHEEGVTMGEAPAVEEGAEAVAAEYQSNPKESSFLVGVDTVGKYRALKAAEIQKIVALGEKMVACFQKLEAGMGEAHTAYLKSDAFKTATDSVPADYTAKLAEAEAGVLARVGEEVAAEAAARAAGVAEGEEPPVESELLKPSREACAVVKEVWSGAMGPGTPVAAALGALGGYLLPLPAPALNCLYAVGCLVGCPPESLSNICGDPDWPAVKASLPLLCDKMGAYDPAAALTSANSKNKVAAVKAFAEGAGLLDAAAYPPTMGVCANGLLPWLQKALAAREAAAAYSAETGAPIE